MARYFLIRYDSGGPHFENGHVVSAGSFQVNGVIITVAETDSVNSILLKINESSAGVTARFDVDSEIIELTYNSLDRAANELENFHAELVKAAVLLRQSEAEKTESLEKDLHAIQDEYTKRYGAATLRSVGLEWQEFDQGLIDYSNATRRRFTKALQRNDTLEHMLLGKNDSDPGLLEQISTTLESFILQQARSAGYGQIINLYA